MTGRVLGIAATLAAAAAMVSAASATAAGPYYTSPSGGDAAPCTPTDRCSLSHAAQIAGAGEDVLLQNTSYAITSSVQLSDGNLVPEIPGTRPTVIATGLDATLIVFGPTSMVRDIDFRFTGLGGANVGLNFQSTGSAERVAVEEQPASSGGGGVVLSGGTLADSFVWAHGSGTGGVFTRTGGGTLRNDTVVATGATSDGLYTSSSYGVGPRTIALQNSIVRGERASLEVSGDGSTAATVNIDHSNFNPPIFGASTTFNAGPGNQTSQLPLFVNALAGDFHEAPGSPTIDAGLAFAGLGALDVDGQPRTKGSAPDIGADEFVPPPAKQKCKKKHKKHHHAAAAKKKHKKCKKKKKKR
jgi:hypothetical protein